MKNHLAPAVRDRRVRHLCIEDPTALLKTLAVTTQFAVIEPPTGSQTLKQHEKRSERRVRGVVGGNQRIHQKGKTSARSATQKQRGEPIAATKVHTVRRSTQWPLEQRCQCTGSAGDAAACGQGKFLS